MEKITFGALPLTGTNLKRVMPIRSVQWRSLTDNNVSFYWFLILFPFDAIGQIGVKFLWFVSYIAQNHRNYIHLSSIKLKIENNIYCLGIWHLGKGLHYKNGSPRFPRDMNFLQIVVGDWYKFLIFPALRRHTWRGSRSSHPSRTSFHQL